MNIPKITDNIIPKITKNSKTKPICKNYAMINSHLSEGGTLAFGIWPQDYVKTILQKIDGYTYTKKFGPDKGQIVIVPDKIEETSTLLPHYHIDKLWSTGKGSGTNSVKSIVLKSLDNPKTNGRVVLDACCIDGKTSPAGFYYKLGFRFSNPLSNQQLENWLAQGGNRENSPFVEGMMYLPKENIQKCLNY